MSDTPTTTKSPLWKQLLGAIAGATVAFVLYQGYTLTSGFLTAAVPTGELPRPTVTTTVSVPALASASSASASSQNRVLLGPFGTLRITRKLTALNASKSSSSVKAFADLVTYSAPTGQGLQSDGTHVWPMATNSFPGQQVVVRSASSSPTGPTRHRDTVAAGQARSAFFATPSRGPLEPGLPTIIGTIESSFISPSLVTAPEPEAVDAWSPGVAAEAEDASLRDPEPVALGTTLADFVTASASVAPAHQPYEKLPQTGFGLDVIAITTIGAVVGRRKMLKKGAK